MKKIALIVIAAVLAILSIGNVYAEEAVLKIEIIRGDNLWTLAEKLYSDPWVYPELAKKNNVFNVKYVIITGDFLIIPETLVSQKGKTAKLKMEVLEQMKVQGRKVQDVNGSSELVALQAENEALKAHMMGDTTIFANISQKMQEINVKGHEIVENQAKSIATDSTDLQNEIKELNVAIQSEQAKNQKVQESYEDFRRQLDELEKKLTTIVVVPLVSDIQKPTAPTEIKTGVFQRVEASESLTNAETDSVSGSVARGSHISLPEQREVKNNNDPEQMAWEWYKRDHPYIWPIMLVVNKVFPQNMSPRTECFMNATFYMSFIMSLLALFTVFWGWSTTKGGERILFFKKSVSFSQFLLVTVVFFIGMIIIAGLTFRGGGV